MKYHLKWELRNGAKGHSEPIDKESAMAQASRMKERHPEDKYWVEPIAMDSPNGDE